MQIICTYTVAVSSMSGPPEFVQGAQKPGYFWSYLVLWVAETISEFISFRTHYWGMKKKRLKSGRISILSLVLLINKNWQELNWLAHSSGVTEINKVSEWEDGFLLEGFLG